MARRTSRRSDDVLEGAPQSVLSCLKVSWIFSECDIVQEARVGAIGALRSPAGGERDAFEMTLQ
jgi:hypothetical protein